MMKSLNNFSSFDMNAFLHGKTLVVKEIKDWLEYKDNQPTGKQLGKKVVTMIVKDDTVYKAVSYTHLTLPTNREV